jgi:cytochrome c oxidase cbb3-type subunit 3/ubiquinol-cytochrome c reductase cytochrome c subunit
MLTVLGAGCDLPGRPNVADRPVPGDEVADFAVLYGTHCAGCHGADGKLGPAPPLNDPLFLAIVPDAELLRVIRDGRVVTPGQKSPMPAFAVGGSSRLSPEQAEAWARLKKEAHAAPVQRGVLTDAQVHVLAEGIKKRWGPPASLPTSAPPYLATEGAAPARKDEGAHVFARACAGCHGKEGEGVERDSRVRRRINDPAFLALISDQELRRYVITGRSDLGMPPYEGKAGRSADFQPLTSEEIDGLVVLLASWRLGGPSNGK